MDSIYARGLAFGLIQLWQEVYGLMDSVYSGVCSLFN
jgi:hypothetical protein